MISPRTSVAAMALSAAALVGIAQFEDYRGTAYVPVKGDVPTIGFGSTSGVKMGDTTTPTRALVRLLEDANSHSEGIKRCIAVPLHQHEFDAYSSLGFNIGVGAFCRSTLVKKLNAGDYAGACSEILRWTYFNGRDCRKPESRCSGLAKRRQGEFSMCTGARA